MRGNNTFRILSFPSILQFSRNITNFFFLKKSLHSKHLLAEGMCPGVLNFRDVHSLTFPEITQTIHKNRHAFQRSTARAPADTVTGSVSGRFLSDVTHSQTPTWPVHCWISVPDSKHTPYRCSTVLGRQAEEK